MAVFVWIPSFDLLYAGGGAALEGLPGLGEVQQ